MPMIAVTAVSNEWTEADPDGSSAVVLQNQGYADVFVRVSATIPTSLEDPGMILQRMEEKTFRDFGGATLWVRSRADDCTVLLWR